MQSMLRQSMYTQAIAELRGDDNSLDQQHPALGCHVVTLHV